MNICDALLLISFSYTTAIAFLYAGPDQILPLMSILGTIIGFLLIWWRRLVGLIRKGWRSASRKPRPTIKLEPSVKLEPSATLEAAATLEPVAKE
jgi:hypothetical protein